MAAEVGEKAPDFTLKSKNQTGDVKDISLSDFKGKNVILTFYPQAFTGGCTDQICKFTENFMEYSELTTAVLGIGVDSLFTQEAWAKQNNITIPLLSDFNKEVIDAYGTRFDDAGFVHGMKGVSKRAVFVIDREGIIRYKEVTPSAGQQPDFDKLRDAVKSLQ